MVSMRNESNGLMEWGMPAIAENLLVMVLTVVGLIGGLYLLLVLLDAWMRFKSGSREQDGLADMLVSARIDASKAPGDEPVTQENENRSCGQDPETDDNFPEEAS